MISSFAPSDRALASPSVCPATSGPAQEQERRFLRPKRPPRASQACEPCRARKSKCDQKIPCSHCDYHALHCHYRKASSNVAIANGKRRGVVSDEISDVQLQKVRQAKRSTNSRDHQRRILPTGYVVSADNSNDTLETTRMPNEQDQTSYEDRITVPERLDLDSAEAAKQPSVHELDLPIGTEIETTGLGGTNVYTNGTEFYGGSSNLAFLDSLFSRARKRARCYSDEDMNDVNNPSWETEKFQDSDSGTPHLSNSQLSIVNLMYNTADPPAPTLESITSIDVGNDAQNIHLSPRHTNSTERRAADTYVATAGGTGSSFYARRPIDTKYQEVEKIFMESYFTNKHYIHPLLSESVFRARCAKEVWNGDAEVRPKRHQHHGSKFLSLYYAVVALGAINAGIDDMSPLTTYYRNRGNNGKDAALKTHSTLEWANFYFGLAKQTLGDVFESASLETCQALFLMTIFSQNALKPHACFMYSGMAVRTAIAIGLSNETSHEQLSRRKEARRTWWSIYSHEVEMCCSSGRLDGLKDPRHYSILLPKWMKESDSDPRELESPEVAMIPMMVGLSHILRTASQDIYHDSTGRSVEEKSQIGFQLEDSLTAWKNKLPIFLNIDSVSLSDTESAFKQKLVLRMRLYNARILIHRPFLVASSTSYNSSKFSQHVEICLDASRKTIQMIYDCFAHRIYLRTWWYCTTYTLYASMVILHLILLEFPKVPKEELIEDVEKSLEIFSAMKFVVARRCAELTKEILAVAKKYLRYPQNKHAVTEPGASMFQTDSLSDIYDESLTNGSETWDDNYLMALLNQGGAGPVRATALANLLNPIVLEDFAVGNNNFGQTVSSTGTSMDQADFGTLGGGQDTTDEDRMQEYAEGDGILGYHFPKSNMDLFQSTADWI